MQKLFSQVAVETAIRRCIQWAIDESPFAVFGDVVNNIDDIGTCLYTCFLNVQNLEGHGAAGSWAHNSFVGARARACPGPKVAGPVKRL